VTVRVVMTKIDYPED